MPRRDQSLPLPDQYHDSGSAGGNVDNRSLASSNLSDYFHDSMPPATLKSTQKEADDNFTNNSPVTTNDGLGGEMERLPLVEASIRSDIEIADQVHGSPSPALRHQDTIDADEERAPIDIARNDGSTTSSGMDSGRNSDNEALLALASAATATAAAGAALNASRRGQMTGDKDEDGNYVEAGKLNKGRQNAKPSEDVESWLQRSQDALVQSKTTRESSSNLRQHPYANYEEAPRDILNTEEDIIGEHDGRTARRVTAANSDRSEEWGETFQVINTDTGQDIQANGERQEGGYDEDGDEWGLIASDQVRTNGERTGRYNSNAYGFDQTGTDQGDEDLMAIEKEHNARITRRKRNRQALILGWILVLFLAVVAIILWFVRRNQSSPSTLAPSVAPSSAPTIVSRRLRIIAEAIAISGFAAVFDPTAPQSAAVDWMVDDDPLQLEPDDPQFVQRYVLSTLVFATDESQTWKRCGPSRFDSPCPSDSERYLSGAPACEWYGIICDNSAMVTKIELRDNGLGGELIPELSSLSDLQSIDLSHNQIGSKIPSAWGLMDTLELLDLQSNDLSGELPTLWPPNIETLILAQNAFSLAIPNIIFTKSLVYADLSGNDFNGALPPTVYKESLSLEHIDISSNRLQGSIPSGLGDLTDLEYLKLNNNRMEGTIPGALFSTNLKVFDVEINRIEGTIPTELFNASRLRTLNVGKNRMRGKISEDFGRLRDLEVLIFTVNNFTGTVQKAIGNLSKIKIFDIGINDLDGTMPEQVCDLLEKDLLYLASDCGERKTELGSPELICSCCTLCYPIHGQQE